MANSTGAVENALWPMPKFKFKVTFAVNKFELHFSEVSGLDLEAQVIKHRAGDSKDNWVIKMPGIQEYTDITLKRGVYVGDNTFFEYFAQIKANTIKKGRDTLTIELLNENDKPTMVWTLHNAWPTKLNYTDIKADGNEAAIDTIVISYEYMTVKNEHNV